MPTLAELGQKVKAKYPDYAHLDDTEVGQRVKAKYPQDYSQFTDIPNPITEGKIPSELKGGPVSYGKEVLTNLPGSAVDFAKGAVTGSPAGIALQMAQGAPDNPMETLKGMGKAAIRPFIHPIDSFKEDPVGTAATLYPSGETAIKGAIGASKGARVGYTEGMKALSRGGRMALPWRLSLGGLAGAGAGSLLGINPFLAAAAGAGIEEGMPAIKSVVSESVKGAAHNMRPSFLPRPKPSMEDFDNTPMPAKPEDVMRALYQKPINSEDLYSNTPRPPKPNEVLDALYPQKKVELPETQKPISQYRAIEGPTKLGPRNKPGWKDVTKSETSQSQDFTGKKPNMDVIRLPKEVPDAPEVTVKPEVKTEVPTTKTQNPENMSLEIPKEYEGHSNPTAAYKVDQQFVNFIKGKTKGVTFDPSNYTLEDLNSARKAMNPKSKSVGPEGFASRKTMLDAAFRRHGT